MLFIRKSISTTSIASRLFSTSTKMTSVKYNFFAGDSHSKIYSKNRPTYPDTLFQEIVKYYEQGNPNHSGSTTCVDIACGTGQATADLVKYFDNVIGVEPAQSQLDNATQHERIKYVNASAEKTTLDSSVANVITVAQALHWFEFDTFFAEMDRILKPKGVLAAWCYVLNIFEKKEAQDALMQLYNGDLGGNWSERRKLVDDHYSTIQFPMTDKKEVVVNYDKEMSIRDYTKYLATWSSYQDYCKKNPNNTLLEDFEDKLLKIYNATDAETQQVKITWPMYLTMVRKE